MMELINQEHQWLHCDECGQIRECLVAIYSDGFREYCCESCGYAWGVEPLEDKPAPL